MRVIADSESPSGFTDTDLFDVPPVSETAAWMLTYLDVFILTAALFASLLMAQKESTPIETQLLEGLPGGVLSQSTPDYLRLEIESAILFAPGEAGMSEGGIRVINSLMPLLQSYPGQIRVEGHTDNLPISTPDYPSNWELAAERALSVLHMLIAQGVEPDRLEAVSLGSTRPLHPNSDPDLRPRNRRVSLQLERAPSW